MTSSTADRRQTAYLKRTRIARALVRVLVPVTFFTVATTAWTDPTAGSYLTQGLDTLRPTATSILADTPLEGILSPVLGEHAAQAEGVGDRLAHIADTSAARLPTIQP
ncbi:MAG: hypothetical protein AB8B62_02610 [Roseobacter sp.]